MFGIFFVREEIVPTVRQCHIYLPPHGTNRILSTKYLRGKLMRMYTCIFFALFGITKYVPLQRNLTEMVYYFYFIFSNPKNCYQWTEMWDICEIPNGCTQSGIPFSDIVIRWQYKKVFPRSRIWLGPCKYNESDWNHHITIFKPHARRALHRISKKYWANKLKASGSYMHNIPRTLSILHKAWKKSHIMNEMEIWRTHSHIHTSASDRIALFIIFLSFCTHYHSLIRKKSR